MSSRDKFILGLMLTVLPYDIYVVQNATTDFEFFAPLVILLAFTLIFAISNRKEG